MQTLTKLTTIVALATISTLGTALPSAQARDGDVRVSGSCTGSSSSKLKLSDEDGRIEAEFEVDQNRNGQAWRVVIKHNGIVVERRRAVTRAPSGSFEVREVVANAAGRDVVRARARNLSTGEVCRAIAQW